MPVQKSRKSKSRKRMRRAHYRQKSGASSLVPCPRCREPKLPHRVCVSCGHYRDREIIKMDEI